MTDLQPAPWIVTVFSHGLDEPIIAFGPLSAGPHVDSVLDEIAERLGTDDYYTQAAQLLAHTEIANYCDEILTAS